VKLTWLIVAYRSIRTKINPPNGCTVVTAVLTARNGILEVGLNTFSLLTTSQQSLTRFRNQSLETP
jgi:hypothetical protein